MMNNQLFKTTFIVALFLSTSVLRPMEQTQGGGNVNELLTIKTNDGVRRVNRAIVQAQSRLIEGLQISTEYGKPLELPIDTATFVVLYELMKIAHNREADETDQQMLQRVQSANKITPHNIIALILGIEYLDAPVIRNILYDQLAQFVYDKRITVCQMRELPDEHLLALAKAYFFKFKNDSQWLRWYFNGDRLGRALPEDTLIKDLKPIPFYVSVRELIEHGMIPVIRESEDDLGGQLNLSGYHINNLAGLSALPGIEWVNYLDLTDNPLQKIDSAEFNNMPHLRIIKLGEQLLDLTALRAFIAAGLDVNKLYVNNYTPVLVSAAESGRVEVVRLLLDTPTVDVNEGDESLWTALMSAIENRHVEIVRLLLDAPNIDVNARDRRLWTALMFAAYGGNKVIVRLLLAAPGINVNAHGRWGKTAVDLARERGFDEIVQLLEAHAQTEQPV